MEIWGYDIRVYFLLFILYAFLGWCMEVTCKLIQYKRFINRGFLIGPYCPIYGYGAIIITVLLKEFTNNPIILFIMAIFLFSLLEYFTSYFMEKIFNARWWDYSQKKINLNGRICADTMLPFGVLGMFVMYVSNPFLIARIELIPEMWLNILFWSLLTIFVADNIVSGFVMKYIKVAEKTAFKELDNTEEITNKVKEILMQKSALHRRLLKAYPNWETVKVKIKAKQEEIKTQVEEQKKEIEDRIEAKTDKIKKSIKDNNKKQS